MPYAQALTVLHGADMVDFLTWSDARGEHIQ